MKILAGPPFFQNVVIPLGFRSLFLQEFDSTGVKYKSGKFRIGYAWEARIAEDGVRQSEAAGTRGCRGGMRFPNTRIYYFTSRVKREAVSVGLEPRDPLLSIFGNCAAYGRLAGPVVAHPCEEEALSGNASGHIRTHPSSTTIEAISEIRYKRREAAGKRPQPQSW